MLIEEIDPNDIVFDDAIAQVFGAPNLSIHEDLTDSFLKEGLIGSIPGVRKVDGKLVCFIGRKFVEFAQRQGLKKIPVQLFEAEAKRAVELAIISNVTKHNNDRMLAILVTYLFNQYSVGKGARTDIKEGEKLPVENEIDPDPDEVEVANEGKESSKKKRNPTVYDKIGPMLGIKAKRAQMLKVVLERIPAYFDRIDIGRSSLYEAYSKCKKEIQGFEQPAPKEKAAVDTTDYTDIPKFSASDNTSDAITAYEYTPCEKESGTSEKKKIIVKTEIKYENQNYTCTQCSHVNIVLVAKAVPKND